MTNIFIQWIKNYSHCNKFAGFVVSVAVVVCNEEVFVDSADVVSGVAGVVDDVAGLLDNKIITFH